ncbi:MAG: glycosyltransferase [Bdellovibrionota bacterium]
MNILFLAPEPFFQERGTPIAAKLALQVLSKRKDTKIKVICYNEGKEESFEDVEIRRISRLPFTDGVRPGASLKKLALDVILFFTTINEIIKNKKNTYDLIHAIEESVFIALFAKKIFGINYIYDMDSSLSDQLINRYKFLKIFKGLFRYLERLAIKNAVAVLPMCDALATQALDCGVEIVKVLRDIALNDLDDYKEEASDLRKELNLPKDTKIVLYVGNLEHYQGIDLLIKSFALIKKGFDNLKLIIIGGTKEHIEKYKKLASNFHVSDSVYLIGPRPVKALGNYLSQGDILASPRIEGENTSMKIYSYLLAGKPIVATNLPTHTQILTDSISFLCEPTVKDFAQGIKDLLENPDFSDIIANNAKNEAKEKYTFEVFTKTLNDLYDKVEDKIK